MFLRVYFYEATFRGVSRCPFFVCYRIQFAAFPVPNYYFFLLPLNGVSFPLRDPIRKRQREPQAVGPFSPDSPRYVLLSALVHVNNKPLHYALYSSLVLPYFTIAER